MCLSNEEFNKEVKIILNFCEEFERKTQHLIQKCNQLKEEMTSVKNSTNIAKSLGTGVAGAGLMAIGLGLSPFTFGISGIVSTVSVVGTVAVAVGGATHVGTDITDSVISKNRSQELKESIEEWDKSTNDLRERFHEFDKHCHKFLDRQELRQLFEDNDSEETMDLIINSFKAGKCAISLGTGIKELVDAIEMFRAIESAKHMSLFSASANWIKNVVTFHGLGANVAKTTAVTTSAVALRTVAAGVGVAFTVVDIVSLVKHWDKKHPVVENVEQLYVQLINNLGTIDVIIKALKQFLNKGSHN